MVVAGFEATKVLVASQVALSFELPFVLVPLLLFTGSRALMGPFRNRPFTTWALGATVLLIGVLNGWLIYSLLAG